MTIRLYTAADALAAQTAVDWQLERIIAVASVGLVHGAPASKKTYCMADLALCTAIGKPWLGYPVRQGPVLLIDEESGPRRLMRRLGETLRGHLARASTPIFATSLEGFNFWIGNAKTGRKELEDAIAQTQAKLVILDALADVMLGGDENAVKDTQRVFNTLRQVAEGTGATLLVIHHGLKNGNGYRGSSAIGGALDVAIEVTSEQDESLVKFKTTKARDAEPTSWAGECHWSATEFWMTGAPMPTAGHAYTTTQRQIITYLVGCPGGATLQDIVLTTGKAEKTVKNALTPLTTKQIVVNTVPLGKGATAVYKVDPLALVDNPL